MTKRTLVRVARVGLISLAEIGVLAVVTLGWLLTRWPLGVDTWLDVSSPPQHAELIVCLGAGTTIGMLPTDDGWGRIFTTSQLYLDGYAPTVIFSGRGSETVIEAEIYAKAAEWFGVPPPAIPPDVEPGSTAEHAKSLLRPEVAQINRRTRLLLVTSPMHSRRTLLTFRKQGFTDI